MWTTYKAVRDKIQTGDVFFTASPALFSRLIRWFTKSKVSHCGLFIEIGDRMFAVESIEGQGVVMGLASNRLKDIDVVVARPKKVPADIVSTTLDDLDKSYDFAGAVLSPFFDTKTSRVFCSEFVARQLRLNMSHITSGITPRDVLTALSQGVIEDR